jgi:NADPH:quinone reductase-like Zn-dependent oxidoreductase
MKGIVVENKRLVWTDVERPALGLGQVRIGVKATAINRADLVQRAGGYPPPPGASPILGLECAGEVLEVGDAAELERDGAEQAEAGLAPRFPAGSGRQGSRYLGA